MTGSRRFVVAASAALAAVLAAPALAAYICHPDPPGTRTLTLGGTVLRYTLDGARVSVAVRSGGACRVVAWNALTGVRGAPALGCASVAARDPAGPPALRAAIRPGSGARPDRLDVFRGARRVAAWPLPSRPRTLHLSGRFAVFAAADGGTYALRLADGRVAALGPTLAGDVPQVGPSGAVFAERRTYAPETGALLKFVPARGLDAEVERDARPLRTGGAIASLAMDGPRVALAVRDRAGRCDRVVYWNVLRSPAQRISAPDGPTCVPGRSTSISSVAIGGFRSEWLAGSGARAALVVGSPLCQEWVVRRLQTGPGGEQLVAMAADGSTLAFAVTSHERELRGLGSVDVVAGRYSPRTILTGRAQPVALAVDGHTVAAALADGTVAVRSGAGARIADLHAGAAPRAVALDGGTLAVMLPGRLAVYDVASGRLVRTLAIPAAALPSLDVQYGIAVVAAGRSVLALDLRTGARVVLARAASRVVGASIERPGVAFASGSAARGVARFVPLARVQALLGRS